MFNNLWRCYLKRIKSFFSGFHARVKLYFQQIWVAIHKFQPSPSPNASPIPNPKTIPNPFPNPNPTPNPK